LRLRLRLLDHNHRSAWSWPHDDSFMARMTRSQQNNGWKDFGYAQKVFHRRVLVELPAKLYGGLRCCKGCGIQNPFFRYGKGVLHSFITTDSQYYPCGCCHGRTLPRLSGVCNSRSNRRVCSQKKANDAVFFIMTI